MRIGSRDGKGEIESWSGVAAWFYNLFNRNPGSNSSIVSFSGVGPGDRVLDIGCGPGAALEAAHGAGAEVTGVDPTDGMVSRASSRVPEATVVKGSAEFLDFDEGAFTQVWSLSAYHHWAYPETGVEQCLKVLEPGGKVLLVEHKLKDGKDGHGLSMGGARDAAHLLETKGFVDASVDIMPVKRKEYVVVSGVKPTS